MKNKIHVWKKTPGNFLKQIGIRVSVFFGGEGLIDDTFFLGVSQIVDI